MTTDKPSFDWSGLVHRLASLSESDRLSAIRELEGLGESTIARVVLQSVASQDANPPVRRLAVEALRKAGGPLADGAELLGRELSHKQPNVRERAAWAACVLQSGDLAFTLRQKIRAETEPSVRVALLHALAAAGNASDLMVAVPFIEARESPVRLAALRTAWMLAGSDASPYLVRGLTDPSEEVRSMAMSVLSARGWPAVQVLLDQMASSSISWQVESAAIVLGGTKSPGAVPLLERLLSHPSGEVRSRARHGLGQLARAGIENAQEALSHLDAEVEDATQTTGLRLSRLMEVPAGTPEPGADVRVWGRRLLAEGRAERWGELVRRLEKETDAGSAAFLVSCLGRLGAKAAVPNLLPYLSHPEARVRANTVEALRLLARADQLDALLPCLEDPDNRVRANALIALANHPAVDMGARLSAMASSSAEQMQLSAVYVAEMVASAQAAQAVASLVTSSFGSVRKAVAALPAIADSVPGARPAPSALLWGILTAFCVGLLALPFIGRKDAERAPEARRRAWSGESAPRPWMPDVPAARPPAERGGPAAKSAPLALPARLAKFLEDVRGTSTSAESFDERWGSLYAILDRLPEELRLEVASLAEMTLLRGAVRSHPQEACSRLDEWLKTTAQLVLPRLKKEETR